ncbi:MAG: MMPL family transporter, partial [Spirochaetaceae bacterium]|nr:MMPL family transporter [Spirochaetaceae bacterium]
FEVVARCVARHGTAVLAGVALVTAAAAWQAARIGVDANIAGLLPQDSQTRRLIDEYGDPAAASELLVVGLSHPELLSLPQLAQVGEVDRRIAALPEVVGSVTPFNVRTFQRQRGGLVLAPLAAGGTAPASEADLAEFDDRRAAAPDVLSALLNPDVAAASMIYSVAVQGDYADFLARVAAILAEHASGLSTALGGWLPLYEATRRYITGEVPLLSGLAALITLLMYLVSFASLRAVVLPLLTICTALLWTFGLMSLAGVPLSMASLMLPPLIFALGSSYSIHLLHRYFSTARARAAVTEPGGGPRARATLALRGVEVAVSVRGGGRGGGASLGVGGVLGGGATAGVSQTIMLAALTTAAGFASLLLSGMQRVREFGLFAALGIVMCALVTMLVYPAVLARLPLPRPRQRERLESGWLAAQVMRLRRLVPRRPRWVYAFLAVLAGALAVSAANLSYQTDVAGFFRGSVAAVDDNRLLVRRFGSYVDLNLTVSVPASSGVPNAEILRRLDRFASVMSEHPDVSHVTSITAYARSLNQVLTGSREYPDNRAVEQLFQRLLALAAVDGGDLGGLLDLERGRVTTRIWVRDGATGWLLSESALSALVAYVEDTGRRIFAAEAEPAVWGWSMVTLRVAELLTREQFTSTVLSALLVLLITSAAFRSLRFGLLTLLPLVTAIMVTFIVMAVAGIPFDVLTVSFAGVAIGVGVDDSIHFLLHYRRAARRDPHTAVEVAMQHAGRAILITTAAIVAGLLALAVSRFLPVVYLGMLISVTLIAATFGTLVLVPPLLGGRGRRRLAGRAARRATAGS